MNDYQQDSAEALMADASFDEALERVRFEAGMMLGVDATQAEQSYHRRRLNRLQYWLLGYGTVAGLRVQAVSVDGANRLQVSPGIAIDGFGREVLVEESWCINLDDWIATRDATTLAEAADGGSLLLQVSLRHKECLVKPTPTLARRLNFGTDGVSYSRLKDAPLLELGPREPAPSDAAFRPWANHDAVPEFGDIALSTQEDAVITGTADAEAQAQLRLHARLLHAFEDQPVDPEINPVELADRARVLLAHLTVPVNTATPPAISNPGGIAVNNLVRPFITTPAQLAWLSAQ